MMGSVFITKTDEPIEMPRGGLRADSRNYTDMGDAAAVAGRANVFHVPAHCSVYMVPSGVDAALRQIVSAICDTSYCTLSL